ncbi:MAG: hypothetical protein HKN47_15770 [Pirellulaceae bacterium]|nr:hypothetical protein [Pirellulaceae bacterium]
MTPYRYDPWKRETPDTTAAARFVDTSLPTQHCEVPLLASTNVYRRHCAEPLQVISDPTCSQIDGNLAVSVGPSLGGTLAAERL